MASTKIDKYSTLRDIAADTIKKYVKTGGGQQVKAYMKSIGFAKLDKVPDDKLQEFTNSLNNYFGPTESASKEEQAKNHAMIVQKRDLSRTEALHWANKALDHTNPIAWRVEAMRNMQAAYENAIMLEKAAEAVYQ